MRVFAEGVEIITGKYSHVSTTFIQEWNTGYGPVGDSSYSRRRRQRRSSRRGHARRRCGAYPQWIEDFDGEQADLNMLGIYFVDLQGEHIEHRTMVVHNHPECKSRVVYKGALDGQETSRQAVRGRQCTDRTDRAPAPIPTNSTAIWYSHLVPSPIPSRISKSKTAISWEQAMHLPWVASMMRELFCLESRGISETEARKLVVRGFFNELVEEIRYSGHLRSSHERHRQASGTR